MKFIFTLLGCLCTSWAVSQTYKTVYDLVEVKQQQTLYLHRGITINGKNRTYIQFRLPANTVSWAYSFGTTVNKSNSTDQFSLKKVMLAALNKAGQAVLAGVNELIKPSGVAAVNVYLTNSSNATSFMNKEFWEKKEPYYYRQGESRQGLSSGVVMSQYNSSEPLCLAFYNPSKTQGVSVHVQIYAYVAREVYVDEWTNTSINQLNKNCLHFFTHSNTGIQEVCDCVIETIQDQYSPKTFLELSSERQELAFNQMKEKCYQSTGNTQLAEIDANIKALYKEINGLQAIKDYPQLVNKYEALLALGKQDAATYNSLAWFCLLSQQLDKAKKALVTGLGENPNNLYLKGNLAHYYLITGNFEEAQNIYHQHKGQQLSEELDWKEMVRRDLLQFEELDIYHPDFNKARKVVGLPPGRLAQVFDPRYGVDRKVSFQKAKSTYVGVITALDKDKGQNTIAYQNIYGEPKTTYLSVLQITPLSEEDYQQQLAAWQATIAQYKYNIGEIGSWKKQDKTLFGTIQSLNDNSHKATISHQNIYGETIQSQIPYLDIVILTPAEHQALNQAWQTTIQQYQFELGEQVTWSTKNLLNGLVTTNKGEIIQLNPSSHQAHIRFVNAKGKTKVVRKGYLLLTKVRA